MHCPDTLLHTLAACMHLDARASTPHPHKRVHQLASTYSQRTDQSTAILSLPPAGDENCRVFIGGLPVFLTEEQVTELLSSFGTVKMLELVKDRETGQSKGYGFAEYEDASVVEIACMGLNGTKMGDRILTVRKAGEVRSAGQRMYCSGAAYCCSGAGCEVIILTAFHKKPH